MSILDRIFGRRRAGDRPTATTARVDLGNDAIGDWANPAHGADERAVARYRYLLRTAPPETIEEAHAEAFARLTPEQRRLLLQELSQELPASELAAGPANEADPRALARLATRAELRSPGTLERTWNRSSASAGFGGVGLGGLMAGGFLSTIAGVVVGTAIAGAFFDNDAGAAESSQTDTDAGGDAADGDLGGGDVGDGGFGDLGDFGGGDFGV